ncbi:MAG: hypothetical protein LBO00_04500 [Zoogloeaceae bacterium]|nr:hypothetical protein [Zoogloeaceae bacterium]
MRDEINVRNEQDISPQENDSTSGEEFNQSGWHGSPNTFDEFDLSYLGRGEGAQVHGWGIYVLRGKDAERKQHANKMYRDRLADKSEIKYRFTGKNANPDIVYEYTNNGWAYRDNSDFSNSGPLDDKKNAGEILALDALEENYGDGEMAAEWLRERQQDEDWADENPEDAVFQEALGLLEEAEQVKPGNLYRVEIPEDDTLLDEDKPFSEQPPKVQAAIRNVLQQQGEDFALEESDDFTGKELYEALSEQLGGDQEASRLLNKAGIDGIAYVGSEDGPAAVIFDDQSIEIIERYYQRRSAEARGSFNPSTLSIELLEQADISTFLHESRHFFLDMYEKVLTDVPPGVPLVSSGLSTMREDFNTILKWAGHEGGFQSWQSAPPKTRREVHEKFACGFEAYLREGKAPNEKMEGIFEQFKAWLKTIYQKLSGLGVKLTPEVRQAMGRMIVENGRDNMLCMEPRSAAQGDSDHAGTPKAQAANEREPALIRLSPERAAQTIAPVRLNLEGWTGSVTELKNLAMAEYAKLQGRRFHNNDMNVEVLFNAEGGREAFRTSGNARTGWKAEMVKVLPELVRRAVKIDENLPDARRTKDTRMFYTLVAPLAVNGRVYTTKITLREALPKDTGTRHKFYDIAALGIENGPDVPGTKREPHGLRGNPNSPLPAPSEPLLVSVGDLVSAIKGNPQTRETASGKKGDVNAPPRREAGDRKASRSGDSWIDKNSELVSGRTSNAAIPGYLVLLSRYIANKRNQAARISVRLLEKIQAQHAKINADDSPKWWSIPSSKQAWRENHARLDARLRTLSIRLHTVRSIENDMGKQIVSTTLGRSVIDALPEVVRNPVLTALYERMLKDIEQGTTDLAAFVAKQEVFIRNQVAKANAGAVKIIGAKEAAPVSSLHKCMSCGAGLSRRPSKKKGQFWWGCSNFPTCKQTYPDIKGRPDYSKGRNGPTE